MGIVLHGKCQIKCPKIRDPPRKFSLLGGFISLPGFSRFTTFYCLISLSEGYWPPLLLPLARQVETCYAIFFLLNTVRLTLRYALNHLNAKDTWAILTFFLLKHHAIYVHSLFAYHACLLSILVLKAGHHVANIVLSGRLPTLRVVPIRLASKLHHTRCRKKFEFAHVNKHILFHHEVCRSMKFPIA